MSKFIKFSWSVRKNRDTVTPVSLSAGGLRDVRPGPPSSSLEAVHAEKLCCHRLFCFSARSHFPQRPERLSTVTALALSYSPRGRLPTPTFEQSRRWWYQWFMTTDRGAEAVRADPKGFARQQWNTWSPPGWFDDAEFEATAKSFENRDWMNITLNAYRSRWKTEPADERYVQLRERLGSVETLSTPTLMIQGWRRHVRSAVGIRW